MINALPTLRHVRADAWTPAEDAYLRGLWADPERRGSRVRLACEVLGRTRWAVMTRASDIGCTRARSVKVCEVRAWAQARREGRSVQSIALEFGRGWATINRWLAETRAKEE